LSVVEQVPNYKEGHAELSEAFRWGEIRSLVYHLNYFSGQDASLNSA
jgi:hypothetical protein